MKRNKATCVVVEILGREKSSDLLKCCEEKQTFDAS